MKIKKYVAPTLKEATEQMKKEMGSNAIILSTRVIENDDNYGSKRLFEITSGIEEEHIPIMKKNMGIKEEKKVDIGDPREFAQEIKKLAQKVYEQKGNIKLDIDNDKIETRDQDVSIGGSSAASIKNTIAKLEDGDVSKEIISLIMKEVKKNKQFITKENLNDHIISSIGALIPTINFEINNKNKTKIVSLVGPTGVGKTTSIAKLAVISKILHNLEIGLISIDTYRLGALDQLRIFSEVSNIDMLVAYEPEEMPKLIESFKKKDVVFIDTVGRSPHNEDSLGKTKEFLDIIDADEVALVLAATHSTKNLLSVAEKFKLFNYSSLLFTKIDEAVTFGNILNVIAKVNVPTMFLTNGQVIPDDIISADSNLIARLIYEGALG